MTLLLLTCDLPYVLRCGPRWAGVDNVNALNLALRPERSTE